MQVMDLGSKYPIHVATGEYEMAALFIGTASYYELCFVSQHAVQYVGTFFLYPRHW